MEHDVSIFDTKLKELGRSKKFEDAIRYLKSVEDIFYNDDISAVTIGFMASKIFGSRYNIFTFIEEIIALNNKEAKSFVSPALQFVSVLYQRNSRHLQEYYILTLSKCTSIATSYISAYDKDKAIDLICTILSLQHDSITTEDIQKIYITFSRVIMQKQSNVLQKRIFILLGTIAKFYPNAVTYENKLVRCLLQPLKDVNPSGSGSATLFSGVFDSLSDIFFNFEHLFTTTELSIIYKGILKLSDARWITDNNRNDDSRAAIKFITKHSFIWSKCLKGNEYQEWHTKLKAWYLSNNNDNRKAGLFALNKFYEEVSMIFETRDDAVYTEIFKTFLNEFSSNISNILNDPKNYQETSDTRLALHGLSMFSKACKTHQLSTEYDKIFGIIVNILNINYLTTEEIVAEKLEYFPDYIKCCSSLMDNIETSEEHILLLQRVSVLMVKWYPKITTLYHDHIIESIILSFININRCDEALFDLFVQRFVCEAIIWSCNVETDSEETNEITYKNYLPLWIKLIDVNSNVYSKHKVPPDIKKGIVTKIFDELIIRLMISTSKLNLKLKNSEGDSPENPNDYVVFLNMVDLYNSLLETSNFDLFRKWIKRFTKHVIERSLNNPLVSGYYKLLARALKISDAIEYFANVEKEDKLITLKTIEHFLEGTISKVQQFKEDLQLSCLNLIFSAPICFVKHLLPTLTPVFQVSFTSGLSYLKIADLAIDTLERWYQKLSTEEISPLLVTILPYLDPYLRNKVYAYDPTKTFYKKPKRYRKGYKQNEVETESEILKLQKKIIAFISQLDPEIMVQLLKGNEGVERVPWETSPSLKFDLPFDMKSSIYLDKIVPRVIELALNSGDRKTRSSACECLHGIMTYLLGTVRNMSSIKSEKCFKKLFMMIMSPLIQLGCDSDELIRQIFNEFNFQLIHWFTSPGKAKSFEASILIENLMSLISHPTNTTLRDYCGKCINEYVKWSIKQYRVDEVDQINNNIKIIIDNICSFCTHPDADKRYGAALAFNNLYVTLREEESMVDTFWVVLLHSFIKSLNFETDPIKKQRNDLEISNAIDHIERVIKEMKPLFNSVGNRKVPDDIGGPLLRDVLKWTLKETRTNNSTCRSKLITLTLNLIPYVDGVKNINDFITQLQGEGNTWFIEIYEKGVSAANACDKNKKTLLRFLSDLLRCLDGYDWVLKHNVYKFGQLKEESRLRGALEYFLNNVATKTLTDFGFEATQTDTELFNKLKCDVVRKVFDLLIHLVKFEKESLENVCAIKNLWTVVTLYIFRPQQIGVDILNSLEERKLQESQTHLLKNLNNLPKELHDALVATLTQYIDSQLTDIETNLQSENVSFNQRQLLKGLTVLQKTIKIKSFPSRTLSLIFENLIRNDATVYLSSSLQEYMELLLKLTLDQKETISTLWNLIQIKTEVNHHETFGSIKHGDYFLNSFRSIIMDHFSQNISELMAHYFKIPIVPSLTNGGPILIELLKGAKRLFVADYTQLVQSIMKNCREYFTFNETMSLPERKLQVNFLLSLSRLLVKPFALADYDFLKNWFILTLIYESPEITPRNMLEFKVKLLKVLPCFTDADDRENVPLESVLNDYIDRIDAYVKANKLNAEAFNLDNAYALILDEWLGALCVSKSPLVLGCVSKIYMKLKEGEIDLDERFGAYFKGLSTEQQCHSIKLIYDSCLCEGKSRLAQILVALLKTCTYDAFERFFSDHVLDIFVTLQESTSSENLVTKSIYFQLIEMLFARIDITKVTEKRCMVDANLNGELLRSTFIVLKNVRKGNFEPGPNEREPYRIYNCNAFNAFVTFISNTKRSADDLPLYTYLFSESANEIVWRRLINCDEQIHFDLDFKTLPKQKKLFATIRCERQIEAPQYILTQNIFESTLSEDICQYDFTKSTLRSTERTNHESFYQVKAEAIDLNQHECIGAICGLIQSITKILPLPTEPVERLPDWLELIRKLMLSDTTERNVKIFFGRVIHNNQVIFEKYAKFFYAPLIELITSFDGLNYYVCDLLDMMLRWTDRSDKSDKPEIEQGTVMKLVTFLIKTIHNDRKAILKFNLEVLKGVIETWKTLVVAPYDLLLEKVIKGPLISHLQVVGIFLANGIIPFSPETVNVFIKTLFDTIWTRYKFEHNLVAEVIGMIFKRISADLDWEEHFERFEKQLITILDKTYEFNKFIQTLEHIQIHYPAILKTFFVKIYLKLTSNEKNAAVIKTCLKNLLRSSEFEANIKYLKSRDITDLFAKSDEDIHLLTLQLVEKIVALTRLKDLNLVINEVIKFKSNPNPNLREAVYDVFIAIYKSYDGESKRISRAILLEGLVDTDSALQEKLQRFWFDLEIKTDLPDIFLSLLSKLYSPEAEANYLSYSVYFLLESCKRNDDYNKTLFEHQLSECKFVKQTLTQSLRHNVFATPLHSDIFSKRKIRNTLPNKFDPTMQSMSVSNSLASASSFLFSTDSVSTRLFASDHMEMAEKRTVNKTYVRYAPRFLKDDVRVKMQHARREVDKKQRREEFRRNRIRQRDANVDLYRTYQVGDFPDIVIPVSSIIQPLQILSKRDNNVARNIYVMLYNSLEEQLLYDKWMEFLKQTYQLMTKIFEETTTYIPDLIGTFFDIFLQYKSNMKINPELLYTLSKTSGLLSTGALLLENQIALYDYESEPKKGCASHDNLDLYWVKLADIYKELKLWDGVTGIFTDKMELNDNVTKAIEHESNTLWTQAIENYKDAFKTDTSYARKNFYADSILKCYANLCEWGKISDYIEQKTLEKLWDDNQESQLQWFFAAGVHETLSTKSNTVLLTALDTWMKDDFKSKLIKDKFSEELSILCLLQNNLKASKYYLENCFTNFLDDYSNINPLLNDVRSSKLMGLQKTIEVHKYLETFDHEFNSSKKLDSLLSFWEKQSNLPNAFLNSETKIVYRKYLIENVKGKIPTLFDEDDQGMIKKLEKIDRATDLNFVSYALRAKNPSAAQKVIDKVRTGRKLSTIAEGDCRLALAMCSSTLLKSPDINELKAGLRRLDRIFDDNVENDRVDLCLETTSLAFKFHREIYDKVIKDDQLITSQGYEIENLLEGCINALRRGIDLGERSDVHTANLADVYMDLVSFLKGIDSCGAYNTDVIKYVLRAMKVGSKRACRLFSYVLRLLETNDYEELFITEASSVPPWMFIPWTPQLLANLDTGCVKGVAPILIELAKTYPQSIMYSYRLRKETLTLTKINESIVAILDQILLNPKVETFIKAISSLHVPDVHLKNIVRNIIDKKANSTDLLRNYYSIISEASRRIDSVSGPIFNSYKTSCESILEMVEKDLTSEIKAEYTKLRPKAQTELRRLESYSPWLANFPINSDGFVFEVPGQYTGDRKPLPQYHTTISSFKNEVHVFASLNQPLKITILGNDAREYEFLVKFGEDLRQDQRIQQLCALANSILQNDPQCRQRNLSIQTYNVTPLTGKTGLIQFVPDTKELRKLICPEKDPLVQEYIMWIQKAQRFKIENVDGDLYYLLNACIAYGRNDVVPKYRDFVSRMPPDLLSKAFWSMSVDVESFTSLRYQFITSYSTMCVINWLLGIGDRHLKNTLVCEKTGRAIGIDFGYAFDTGIRNMLYPELVPFRLTPQILNVIEPFREQGFIKLTMIHSLRAFRKEKDILLSAMDVFINEPTLSWLEGSQNKSDFVPKEKLANAELKLNGCNPIKVTLSELSKREDGKEVYEALCGITRGDTQFNIRSRLPLDGLTEENQVLCLLDQATDENILGRCYWGYEPWL